MRYSSQFTEVGSIGVSLGMVRGLPVVLDCGEACLDADRDRAWNCRLPAAHLMKVLPAFPGHFSPAHRIAFGAWVVLGIVLHVGGMQGLLR